MAQVSSADYLSFSPMWHLCSTGEKQNCQYIKLDWTMLKTQNTKQRVALPAWWVVLSVDSTPVPQKPPKLGPLWVRIGLGSYVFHREIKLTFYLGIFQRSSCGVWVQNLEHVAFASHWMPVLCRVWWRLWPEKDKEKQFSVSLGRSQF